MLANGLLLMLAAQSGEPPPSASRATVAAHDRGNTAMFRESGALMSVSASLRLAVLLPGGSDVIQPMGFGAGLDFRVHAARRAGPLRFGGGVHVGHSRFLSLRRIDDVVDGEEVDVRRWAALGHSDFTLGPSVQALLGPVLLEADCGVGVAISTFNRPTGANAEDAYDDVSFMIRPSGRVIVPVRRNQGVAIGAAYHRFFSDAQAPINPADLEPTLTNPFDGLVEVTFAYHFMF